ncbi:hypothetical protein SDC9_199103 [bioreactor metagenome]|uniref:Uncharacterized protein n=1 Tax=bioreactor metagenome TaxID=1076179 RepID=A0A645IJK1_9ZZZZ
MRRVFDRYLHGFKAHVFDLTKPPGAFIRKWGRKEEGVDSESHDFEPRPRARGVKAT